MKAIIYYEHDWQWERFFHSCKAGLEKLGYDVEAYHYGDSNKKLPDGQIRPADVVVTWGYKTFALELNHWAKINKKIHIVGERGYLGERINQWTSIGIGGLNGEADFKNHNSDSYRFHKYFRELVKPPKANGEYILIAGQVPGDASLRKVNGRPPYEEWINEIKKQTTIPIIYRKHPDTKKEPTLPVTYDLEPSLEKSLDKARLLVTHNSNSAVISLISGVPAITMDRGSMAWDITPHSLGNILEVELPCREQWLFNLSYTQWLQNEISSAEPLIRLLR